jgi:hypothetical protein
MTQISELVGSGKILIDKMPRGSVEYWITVHRADDDTTSGQGSIHGIEYVLVEAENSGDVQLALETGFSIAIIILRTAGGSAGVRMISAPGPLVP